MARTLLLRMPTGVTSPAAELVHRTTRAVAETITLTESATKRDYTGTITAAAATYDVNLKSGSAYIGGDEVIVAATDGVTYLANSVTLDLSGTTVAAVTNTVGSVTGNVGGNVVGSVASVVGNLGGNVVGSVASVTAGVTLTVGAVTTLVTAIWQALTSALTGVGSIGKLIVDNLNAAISTAATPAQVNAEVWDVMNVDTHVEPGQGTPAATASIFAKINFVYKAWRNRKTQDANWLKLLGDDGTTVDQKSAVSNDGTTTTLGEIQSGP